jgi:hypothetical protein
MNMITPAKTLAVSFLMAIGTVVGAPSAAADQFGINCDTTTVHTGFLGLNVQQRTICDTPFRPDGSWGRTRTFWIPAHHVSAQSDCSSSSYSSHCTYTDAYDVDDTVVQQDKYDVFPYNVLPDEPGHLPA